MSIAISIAFASITGYTLALYQQSYNVPSDTFTVSGYNLDENQLNTIVVSGVGTMSAEPNEATVWIGVQTEASSASDAVRENAEKMRIVISALKATGVTDDQIETAYYNLYPNYDWERNMIVGYTVTNQLKVKIFYLSDLGTIIDIATSSGANQIHGVYFSISEDQINELKSQALQKAVLHAQSKATVIAEALGVTISSVIHASENTFFYEPYRNDLRYGGEALSTPIIPGDVEVTVSVQIIFSFD